MSNKSDGVISSKKWITTTLDKVAYIEMGQSPDSLFYNTDKIGLPFFQGKTEFGERYPTVRKWCSEPTKIAQVGDILLSIRAPVGPTNIASTLACIGRGLAAIRAESGISQQYLFYFFRHIEPWLSEQGTGTTFAAISGQFLREISISVAPTLEQTRIVDKLEELLSDLDAGVNELKAAQKKLGQYRQSLLKAAVEGELTADWRANQKLATNHTSSSSPRRRGPSAVHAPTIKAKSLGSRRSLPSKALVGGGNDKIENRNDENKHEEFEHETGTQLLQRILKERRNRWETKQLVKYKEQNKTPPTGWKEKYPEPAKPDTAGLPKLPEGWVWATLSQIGWLDRGRSKHRPRNAPHLYGGPYPFVQTGDIRHADTFIATVESSYSVAGLAQSRLWPIGTICITIAANIGKTAILAIEACFPDSVVGFLPATDEVSSRFVEYFLRTAQQKLEDEAPATAQKNINLEILEKVCIPLPPINEQQQIVEILGDALCSAGNQENSIAMGLRQSAAQRKNILKAAFSGQLVPQNPNDEPASVLLERIRTERTMKVAPAKKPAIKKSEGKANRVARM